MVDRFWTDVIGHCANRIALGSRIMGPKELAGSLDLAYNYADSPAADAVDTLILHKGSYVDLDPRFLSAIMSSMKVHFANEVFIIFSRGELDAPVETQHMGILPDIEAWLRTGGYRDGATEALAFSDKPRMAATYVGQGRVLLQNRFGQLMLVAGEDTSIVPHLIRDGWFDLDLTRFLSRTLRAGDVFVDVGANFGTYSLLAAAIVGPAGKVVAIEANQAIAEMLHENLVMNGFGDRSTVVREAAGEASGVKTLFQFSIRQGGSTMLPAVADLARGSYAERISKEEVPCRPLNAILSSLGIDRVAYLKIDVEGFELNVLKGALDSIKSFRPRIILEWHPSFFQHGSGWEMYDLLTKDLGYNIRVVGSNGTTSPVDFKLLQSLNHADIFAIPIM
jgi:FkbM family methyltransferase